MTIETHTAWGREFSPEEILLLDARKTKLLSEGVVYGTMFNIGGTHVREWATIELANDWVKFANSMNPPPIKVEVVVTE